MVVLSMEKLLGISEERKRCIDLCEKQVMKYWGLYRNLVESSEFKEHSEISRKAGRLYDISLVLAHLAEEIKRGL